MIPDNQIYRFCIVMATISISVYFANFIAQWIHFQEKYDLYTLLFLGKEIYLRQPVSRRDLNVVLIHSQIYAINMFLKQPLQKRFPRRLGLNKKDLYAMFYGMDVTTLCLQIIYSCKLWHLIEIYGSLHF